MTLDDAAFVLTGLRMGDAGIAALARALPQMASLMTLKLYRIARLRCDSRRLIMSLARRALIVRLSPRPKRALLHRFTRCRR